MPITTDLNVSPYYDDYSANNKFHRVLFQPSVPVQARELTQLQSMLQQQIEQLGAFTFKEGSIISGCSITDRLINRAKINDANTSSNTINMATTFSTSGNTFVRDSANLIAEVVTYATGYEATNPDLNTLYFTYLNTGNSSGVETKTFSTGSQLTVFPVNASINAVALSSNTGTLYSNADTITFSSTYGTNGTANLTTNSTGGITGVSFNNTAAYGHSYRITDIPTVVISTSTGTGGNTELFTPSLTPIDIVTVANATFTVSGDSDYNVIGKNKIFHISDGQIFQKGHFIDVDEQSIIVHRNDPVPDQYSVGFMTTESIVNGSTDSTLLDNAAGFQNENAPGAHRLKMTANLVVNTTSNAESTNNFFIIAGYEQGHMVYKRQDHQLEKLGDIFAKRTKEESGDYVIRPFLITSEEIESSNVTHVGIAVSPGKGYVGGRRVETVGTSRQLATKATTTKNVSDATVTSNYGNYIELDEYIGHFSFNTAQEVKLLDTAGNRISTSLGSSVPTVPTTSNSTVITGTSPSFTGNILGTAKIRSVLWKEGAPADPAAKYKLFLFDIKMNTGKDFQAVRSVWYNAEGIGDVVLQDGVAKLKDTDFKTMVVPLGQKGIKSIDIGGTQDIKYTYRTAKTDGSIAVNGSITLTTTGTEYFPYTASSTLNDTQEAEFVMVSNNTSSQTVALTGTSAVTSGSNAVTGSGTSFTTEYVVGDFIRVADANTHRITGIQSDTVIVTGNNFGTSVSGKTHKRYFPADMPINLHDSTSSNVVIGSNANTAVINMSRGKTLENVLPVHTYYNVKKNSAVQMGKTMANCFIKLDCGNNTTTTSGPWCLGITDPFDIQDVWIANGSYVTAAANSYLKSFTLDTGQKDSHYGLAYLRKVNTSLTLSTNDQLLVKVRTFTKDTSGGGFGFFTVDSYPVDDSAANSTNQYIKTAKIPIFTSPATGKSYDLRNSFDFRPVTGNTANQAAIAEAGATINPANTDTFTSAEHYIAKPNGNQSADYNYYQPRIDKVSINEQGILEMAFGTPGDLPLAPPDKDGSMTLGVINVPVYPSDSIAVARNNGRPDYAVTATSNQPRGYTMKDIGQIESRINRLEYYTSLNLLEKQTKDLLIQAESNTSVDRFKNGFLVDSFKNFAVGSITDPEYKAGIDKNTQTLVPRAKQRMIKLKVDSTDSNTTHVGDLLMLNYNDRELTGQRFATKIRNTTQGFWQYNGTLITIPSFDNFYEVRNPPESIHIDIDTTGPTVALLDELNKMTSMQEIRVDVLSDSSSTRSTGTSQTQSGSMRPGSGGITTTSTETFETIRTIQEQESRSFFRNQTTTTKQHVGEFVTDFTFRPYIREQRLVFWARGLMPNRTHYIFFDEKDASSYTQPAVLPNTSKARLSQSDFQSTGSKGDTLVSNSLGQIAGSIYVPQKTFLVGERKIVVADISTYSDIITDSMSWASGNFNAYNFGLDKQSIDISTRSISISKPRVVTGTSTRTDRNAFSTVDVVRQPASPAAIIPEPPDWGSNDVDGAPSGVSGDDPLAQTFRVDIGRHTNMTSGVHLTKVDAYFKTKDPTLGITLQCRKVSNGFPQVDILPFGDVFLESSEVSTSDDASAATTFTFDSPIFVNNLEEYCFVLMPEGNGPNYQAWVSKTGGTDVTTSQAVYTDQLVGTLFLSTNNTAWEPMIDEDLKLTVYHSYNATSNTNAANWTQHSGTVKLTNEDHEFFTVNAIAGTFVQGEHIFQSNASAQTTGTVAVAVGNNTVTGTGTSFTTEYSAGDVIVFANATHRDIKTINAISNTTSLTLNGWAELSNTGGLAVYKTPVGRVMYFNETDAEVQLEESTSTNSTFKFAAGSSIIGADSGANAVIQTVDNVKVSHFEPLMNKTTVPYTNISMKVVANTSGSVTGNTTYRTNDRNFLDDYVQVMSKSNELAVSSTHKSWSQYMTLHSNHRYVSPTIDTQAFGNLLYENIINNVTTNEHLGREDAGSTAAYISRMVTLDDNLDAEDLRVYLTAFKPGEDNVDIKVYAKLAHQDEIDDFIDRQWTELELVSADDRSDSSNREDYREYTYSIPAVPSATALTGKGGATSGAATITTTEDLSGTISAGDVIKIDNAHAITDYHVEAVTAANSTVITVGRNLDFTNAAVDLHKLDYATTAFKDPQNSKITTYLNSSQYRFTTYKTWAIKIVLLTDDIATIPRVKDYRALALSV